jgi:hypothetical protein
MTTVVISGRLLVARRVGLERFTLYLFPPGRLRNAYPASLPVRSAVADRVGTTREQHPKESSTVGDLAIQGRAGGDRVSRRAPR